MTIFNATILTPTATKELGNEYLYLDHSNKSLVMYNFIITNFYTDLTIK